MERSPMPGVIWGYRMHLLAAHWRKPGAAWGSRGEHAMADYQRAADWRWRTRGE